MTDGLRVAFGFRPHSGWSALVTLARSGSDLVILQRRRIELVDAAWAKQPYHAAEKLEPRDARTLVERGVGAAHEAARAAMKALVEAWLNSAALFNQEERFGQVLKLAGFPVKDVTFDSPLAEYPYVYKAYIAMQRPLVTSDIPQSVKDALQAAAKRDRPSVERFNLG